MSFSPGPFSVSRRGSIPVDDTSSHLFTPCVLRSCTNHPAENKTNADFPISPTGSGIAATGVSKMRKMEKKSCSLTHSPSQTLRLELEQFVH